MVTQLLFELSRNAIHINIVLAQFGNAFIIRSVPDLEFDSRMILSTLVFPEQDTYPAV